MRMWLDAIQSLGADLEILFFRDTGEAGDAGDRRWVAQQLHEAWGSAPASSSAEREDLPHRPGLARSTSTHTSNPPLDRRSIRTFARSGKPGSAGLLPAAWRDLLTSSSLPAHLCDGSGHRGVAWRSADTVRHRRYRAPEIRTRSGPASRWRLKPLLYLQVPALWWGERQAIARADCAFVCSEIDRRYLWRAMRVRNLEVIPNAVGHVEERPLPAEPTVLFLGAYGYPPNAVAADYLIRGVAAPGANLPPGSAAHRGAELGGARELSPSSGRGSSSSGSCRTSTSLYQGTRIVALSIQAGTGTRFKILEAASYGVPVVSTAWGPKGSISRPTVKS